MKAKESTYIVSFNGGEEKVEYSSEAQAVRMARYHVNRGNASEATIVTRTVPHFVLYDGRELVEYASEAQARRMARYHVEKGNVRSATLRDRRARIATRRVA